MTDEPRPAHSILGASGMERWENCPGSVTMRQSEFCPPDTSNPEFRTAGHIAHAGAAYCLETGQDAWEVMGQTFDAETGPAVFGVEHVRGAQDYIDLVREDIGDDGQAHMGFEVLIWDPAVHKHFGGTVDAYIIKGDTLYVRDYKNGAGVVVDVERNRQLLYYAYGVLRKVPEAANVKFVILGIVQPNAYGEGGGRKEWLTTAEFVREWAAETLLPAMNKAGKDGLLKPGKWCQFCPAKLICPAMRGLFAAMAFADASQVKELTDEQLAQDYAAADSVRFFLKALEGETYRRLMEGRDIAGTKLVDKKADRVWKDGAEDRFKGELGAKAYADPKLRSPADMEKQGPEAKKLTKEWAYTPRTGFTVAPAGDKRATVKPSTSAEVFGAAVEQLNS